uniref:Putative secreted protein n=1 Tax=Amblyomma parvum TaxID=251391 RepID=A0A023G0Z7_AMBPA
MTICKALLLFALVAAEYVCAKKPEPYDERCKTDRPPIQNPGCQKSFVYVRSKHKCAWTCGRGLFVSRQECDAVCRTPAVCTWRRPSELCTEPFKVYYLRRSTGKCALDRWGCRYTGNNFPTLKECQSTCKAG